MVQIVETIRTILELGLVYSLVVLSVHLSSNIIKFDDLSTEGSFAIGGAIVAVLVQQGISSLAAIFIAIGIGGCVGVATGFLYTKLKLNNLISGIVVTTALFSINLKMAGANVTLSQVPTLLDAIKIPLLQPWSHLMILLVISVGLMKAVDWILKTEIGFLLHTTGSNPHILATLGKSVSWFKVIGLTLSNSLTSLAGALFVLHIGFFSISGSIGALAISLAGLIIGQVLCKNHLIGAIVGAIGYQTIITLTVEMQLNPVWNKLITAVLIVFLVCMRKQQTLWGIER
jgi:putative ABC transport system permease protein